jgi:hypothetical protein
MTTYNLIDYSEHSLNVQAAIKGMNIAMLERDYEAAMIAALNIIVEAKLAYNAIRHEKEMEEARAAA